MLAVLTHVINITDKLVHTMSIVIVLTGTKPAMLETLTMLPEIYIYIYIYIYIHTHTDTHTHIQTHV